MKKNSDFKTGCNLGIFLFSLEIMQDKKGE